MSEEMAEKTTEPMRYERWREVFPTPRWAIDRHVYALIGFLYLLGR